MEGTREFGVGVPGFSNCVALEKAPTLHVSNGPFKEPLPVQAELLREYEVFATCRGLSFGVTCSVPLF